MLGRTRSYLSLHAKIGSVVNRIRGAGSAGRAFLLLAVLAPALWSAGSAYASAIHDGSSGGSRSSFEQAGRAAGTLWQCPLHRSGTTYR